MIDEIKIVRLNENHLIKHFDCGDKDLNDFLINDAKRYQQQMLAVTYIFETAERTLAFYSLLADKISVADVESGNQWKKNIKQNFPKEKQFRSYPAIKIGRLGVDLTAQGKGIGKDLMQIIKFSLINDIRFGYSFITVDAYRQSLRYYEKNDFLYLSKKDENDDTRLMFFDLRTLIN